MASLNADITSTLKKAFDLACVDRERSLKDAVAEALAAWIAGEPKWQGDEADGVPDDLSPYLTKLAKILSGEDETAKRLVIRLIDECAPRASRKAPR